MRVRVPPLLLGLVLLPLAARTGEAAATWERPSAGALLVQENGRLVTRCSGVLIGCQTFLTAAHCLCGRDLAGDACAASEVAETLQPVVFLQHAGLFPATSVTVHPAYDYPESDLALVRFDPMVSGLAPSPIATSPPALGSPAVVVGFGRSGRSTPDPGLKRYTTVATTGCGETLPDQWLCWGFAGAAPRVCEGDAGAPLFADGGAGPALAGLGIGFTRISAARPAPLCIVAGAGLDADLSAHLPWIRSEAGADLDETRCGNIPQVGEPGASITTVGGTLGPTRATAEHAVYVTPNTQVLRVVLNGQETGAAGPTDLDLYVRARGSTRLPDYCAVTGAHPYAACEFASPPAGPWDVRIDRMGGAGEYQLTTTAFGGDAPRCGNGVREVGEDCDGSVAEDCPAGCDERCACVACSHRDLEFDQVLLARRLFLKATLRDPVGQFSNLDPRAHEFVITVVDDRAALMRVRIPPGDPGWAASRPREGLYRWRGFQLGARRIILQDRTRSGGWWRILIDGQDVLGADALGYNGLRLTIALGGTCAVKTFP
jgi:hypothetical protein